VTFATDTEQGAAKLDRNVIEANLEAIQLTPRSHRHIDVGEPGEVRGRERGTESMSARGYRRPGDESKGARSEIACTQSRNGKELKGGVVGCGEQ
jgi:hypothetical protein